jgi:hypothetical protein
MSQTNKTPWTKDRLFHLLDNSELAVAKAVLTLYGRQTADEQVSMTTKHANRRGFNARHAEFLTSIAKALPLYNNRMTPKQLAKVRPMVKVYWRQLLEEIEAKGQPVVWQAGKRPIEARPDDGDDDGQRAEQADERRLMDRLETDDEARIDEEWGAWA